MRKDWLWSYLTLGILFALFHVVAFIVPIPKIAVFWIAYAFSIVSFAVQIPTWSIAIHRKDTFKKNFLGIPLLYISVGYLVVQQIIFAVFSIVSFAPAWVAVVVCTSVFAGYILCVIAGCVSAIVISRNEERIDGKRDFLQSLIVDVDLLIAREPEIEIKKALEALREVVRFSDPISHETLRELETRITIAIQKIKWSIDKKSFIAEAEALLVERNTRCRAIKT